MNVKKRNIIDQLFEEEYQNKDPQFLSLIDRFCFKDDDEIKNLILKVQNCADLQLYKEDFFNTFIQKFYSKEFIQSIEKLLIKELKNGQKKLDDESQFLSDIPVKKGGPKTIDEVRDQCHDFFASESYDDLITNLIKINFPTQSKKMEEEDKATFQYVKSIYKELVKLALNLPPSSLSLKDSIEKNIPYAQEIIALAKKMDEIQYAYKKEKNVFEFQDIAKMALNLVKNHEEVRSELKAKYRMIMIDEYQDTSSLQEAFISLISNHNVYMVGDIKQSIYAFRNANSENFAAKYDAYKKHLDGEAIDMNKNFRSRQEVLEDINTIFSKIMTPEIGGADYAQYHLIQYGNLDYLNALNEKQNNHSSFITYSSDLTSKEREEIEAKIIAEDIIHKVNEGYSVYQAGDSKKGIATTRRPVEFKDFCILMDRGTSFGVYQKVFTQYHIPLYVQQDEDIKDNVIVKLLSNLLVMVKSIQENDYASSDFILAFLSLSRSFIFQEKDEDIFLISKTKSYQNSKVVTTIAQIVKENKGLSNYELLLTLILKLDIYHKLVYIGEVKKNEGYLDAFLGYFKSMSELDYSLTDFITYLKYINEYELKITLSSSDSSMNSVRIMNIHKSKGLEFPIIYFPGLTRKFNKEESKASFGISSKYGLYLPNKEEDFDSCIKTISNMDRAKSDLSEKIRLFYVSLTRTREKMIFVLPEPTKEIDISLAKSFYDFISPFIYQFPHTYHENEIDSNIELNIPTKEIENQTFDYHPITFLEREKEIEPASKNLHLGTKQKLLDFGIRMHEVMEIIDFKEPDLSMIKNALMKNEIQKFLDSSLMKNIQKANIYKELEFNDGIHHGIIDLLLEYEDHFEIIDYKLKNINDQNYENQLHTYWDFLTKKSSKNIRMFLYSLLDFSIKEIK